VDERARGGRTGSAWRARQPRRHEPEGGDVTDGESLPKRWKIGGRWRKKVSAGFVIKSLSLTLPQMKPLSRKPLSNFMASSTHTHGFECMRHVECVYSHHVSHSRRSSPEISKKTRI